PLRSQTTEQHKRDASTSLQDQAKARETSRNSNQWKRKPWRRNRAISRQLAPPGLPPFRPDIALDSNPISISRLSPRHTRHWPPT
ncbi:hypothetical protein ElyMa_000495700, partial [Elysia marginata]